MSTHEVRCRGHLITHMTEDDAAEYVERRMKEAGADRSLWTIEDRKPVELLKDGTLIETFDLRAEASDRIERDVEQALAEQPGLDEDAFRASYEIQGDESADEAHEPVADEDAHASTERPPPDHDEHESD